MRSVAVITETLDPDAAQWLSQHAEVVWRRLDAGDQLNEDLARADALIVRTYTIVNAALLDRAPKLKVVARAGVGLDNVDVAECRRRGVEVVYSPDANTQAVVEYVIALMLDAFRPRASFDTPIADAAFHEMRKRHVGTQLDTLTLGILGFGRVGKRLGKVASAIGMKLLVNDLLPEQELRGKVDYDFTYVDKPALWSESQVLSIHVDGRAANRHMISDDVLARLRPDCLLINTSRGMVIDARALATWAKTNLGAGARAILDVHDPEPPPGADEYPLYHRENVRLLPHLASRTDKALANMSDVVRDVVAVLEGRRPQNPAPRG